MKDSIEVADIDFDDTRVKTNDFYIKLKDEEQLRVIRYFIPNSADRETVVFLPGFISTIYSWRYFIIELLKIADIFYIESREKSSSILQNRDFTIRKHVEDLVGIIEKLKLKDDSYHLAGSSLGATIIIESIAKQLVRPNKCVLILPNKRFRIPMYVNLLKIFPNFIKKAIVKVLIFYVEKNVLDKKDIGQKERFFWAINNADLLKLIYSAFELSKYRLEPNKLKQLKLQTLLINSSNDRLHFANDIKEISLLIDKIQYEDVVSFTKSRNSFAAKIVSDFIR